MQSDFNYDQLLEEVLIKRESETRTHKQHSSNAVSHMNMGSFEIPSPKPDLDLDQPFLE